MPKKNESRPRPRSAPSAEVRWDKPAQPEKPEIKDGFRETVESIVIAFVLAFLFRTFEAEAFVIPTGSMAPTLMGQHKDTACNKCGFPFRVSASQEEPPEYVTRPSDRAMWPAKHRVMAFTCPNCRYQMRFGEGAPDGEEPPPSYKGDRILVGKLSYEIDDPKRWDVAVFKFPESAKINFIKRVAGVPNETLVISHGDVLTGDENLSSEEIDPRSARQLLEKGIAPIDPRDVIALRRLGKLEVARKSPEEVQAILQTVYDNNYQLSEPWQSEFPPRWSPLNSAGDQAWTVIDGGKAFQCEAGDEDDPRWLAYCHLTPSARDWLQTLKAQSSSRFLEIKPRLITDFYAYNTGVSADSMRSGQIRDRFFATDAPDQNWVGDLSLDCRLQTESDQGEAMLALVEGGSVFTCRIDLSSGQASFSISSSPADASPEESFTATAQTPVRGPGSHRVEFANVDDKLFLWVDGKSIPFEGEFGPLENLVPTAEDLAPARVGSRGAALQVSDLRVRRDVYYTDPQADGGPVPLGVRDFFSDPRHWGEFEHLIGVAYVLGDDEYLMLGDNSPQSKDSRLWMHRGADGRQEYYVKRDLMIGKALLIYWPHSLDHLPKTDIWFPLFPNFGRMGFVR